MKSHHIQTVLYWIILAIAFIGIVGYEWLPSSYRGGWLFVLTLMISGALVRFGTAILIGVIAFFCVSVYFLFDLSSMLNIQRQILLLFTVMFAPLFLSAVRYNLYSTKQESSDAAAFISNYNTDLLPLRAWQNTSQEVLKVLPFLSLNYYEIIHIKITNVVLIQEMLGEHEWLVRKNKIIQVLATKNEGAVYHFASENLDEIRSIVFRQNASQEQAPLFLEALKNIDSLQFDIHSQLIETHGAQQGEAYVHTP